MLRTDRVDWAEVYQCCRVERDWCLIAEQPAPAPHLARPEGRAALRIVLIAVARVSRSFEHFPVDFDLGLLRCR